MSEQYINTTKVRVAFGGISLSTLNRQLKTDKSLPQPVKLGRNRYWLKSAVDEYLTTKFAAAQEPAE